MKGRAQKTRNFLAALNARYAEAFEPPPPNAAQAALDASAEARASWNNKTFAELFAEEFPGVAERCPLLAREPALAREGALLGAMLEMRWDRRPSAAWLAREFGDEARRRCGDSGETGIR